MNLQQARLEAWAFLEHFIGHEITTDLLNSLEDQVNNLIRIWAAHKYFVTDDEGAVISGIKLYQDPFDDSLCFEYRYPTVDHSAL